jgi:RNA polymerase sigma factor (sigma-70 family)
VPDLCFDTERGAEHFGGWLATILSRNCRQALRRLRRSRLPAREITENDPAPERQDQLELRIDISEALDRLQEPQRSVVSLYGKGLAVTVIAQSLGLSIWTAHRILQRGLRQLQIALRSHRPNAPRSVAAYYAAGPHCPKPYRLR